MISELGPAAVASASLRRASFELLSLQDDILRRAVAMYQGKNWKKIGEEMIIQGASGPQIPPAQPQDLGLNHRT